MAQAMIGQRRQGGGRLLTTRMDTSEMEYRERDVVGGSPARMQAYTFGSFSAR